MSGAAIAAGNVGTYSFAGVPGRLYSVWGDSCDPYQIQVFGDSFYGVLSTRATDFSWDDDAKEVVLTTTETGLPLCENGTAWHWATHNYYHADGNGNITALVAANETLTASYRYDPFGNTTSSSGGLASANVYRFSSKEQHANSSMYYYGYRFYDPPTQRWLNRDPIGENGGFNLYALVNNNPIIRYDPDGRKARGIISIIAGILFGGCGKAPTKTGPGLPQLDPNCGKDQEVVNSYNRIKTCNAGNDPMDDIIIVCDCYGQGSEVSQKGCLSLFSLWYSKNCQ